MKPQDLQAAGDRELENFEQMAKILERRAEAEKRKAELLSDAWNQLKSTRDATIVAANKIIGQRPGDNAMRPAPTEISAPLPVHAEGERQFFVIAVRQRDKDKNIQKVDLHYFMTDPAVDDQIRALPEGSQQPPNYTPLRIEGKFRATIRLGSEPVYDRSQDIDWVSTPTYKVVKELATKYEGPVNSVLSSLSHVQAMNPDLELPQLPEQLSLDHLFPSETE